MSSITKEVLSSLSSEKLLYCDRLCLLEYWINVWLRFLVRLTVNKIYLAGQCISKNLSPHFGIFIMIPRRKTLPFLCFLNPALQCQQKERNSVPVGFIFKSTQEQMRVWGKNHRE